MLGFRKKILGIDLGHRSVKGVILSRRGTEVILEDYFYVDLKETLEEGREDDRFPSVLAALIDGAGLRNTQVASAIEDRELQVVNFSLPGMPEEELQKAVRNELEVQLGLSANDLAIDYSVTSASGEITRPSPAQLNVHAFYTKRANVQEHLNLLESASLRPFAVESALHAALEAARFNDYLPAEESCLLVDVGESHTSVGLVTQGELIQFNVIRVGSGDINQSLMQQLECTYHDSELRKLSYKLEHDEGAAVDPDAKAIEQGYYQIILGIHDTAAYFRASRKTQGLKSIVLTGGGLMNEGAISLMENSLNLPVVVVDPLRKIQIFKGNDSADRERLPRIGPMLHVAVGLALRGVA
jgi:type IV pilus assembly protein PilM